MKNVSIKFASFMLAMLTVLSLCSCSKKEENTVYCVKSDNFTVTEEMYSYFFNSYYRSFVEKYTSFVSSSGLDTRKSLSSQIFSSTETWYDYMSELVKGEVLQMIALNEEAKANKAELDEENLKTLEETKEQYAEAASAAGQSVDDYYASMFGEGVCEAVVDECLRIQLMSSQYYEELYADFSPSVEDCESYYEENPEKLLKFDAVKITTTKENAELLQRTDNETDFVQRVKEIITDTNYSGEYEQNKDEIDYLVQNKYVLFSEYDSSDELSVWAFEEGREPGDIYTEEQSTGDITVAIVLPSSRHNISYNSVLYLDDTPLKNISYIVFTDEDELNSAYSVYEKNPTGATYEALCDKYSENFFEGKGITYSKSIGGLRSWIFASERKVGDVDKLILGEEEYCIIRLEKDGELSWIDQARNGITNDNFDGLITELSEKYNIEENEETIYEKWDVVFN